MSAGQHSGRTVDQHLGGHQLHLHWLFLAAAWAHQRPPLSQTSHCTRTLDDRLIRKKSSHIEVYGGVSLSNVDFGRTDWSGWARSYMLVQYHPQVIGLDLVTEICICYVSPLIYLNFSYLSPSCNFMEALRETQMALSVLLFWPHVMISWWANIQKEFCFWVALV